MTLLPPIGLFGGTFDPIHQGHITLATQLLAQLPLESIQLIPCHQSPLRQLPIASDADRLAMIQLACHGQAGLSVNPLELQQAKPSYTVDTLERLREQQPQRPWCFILSMDAFSCFNRWHQWQHILKLAHLIVVNRPGFTLPQQDWIQSLLAERQVTDFKYIKEQVAGKILLQEIKALDISATQIRQLLQQGKDIGGLVPTPVQHYIQQHTLYQKPSP